MAVDYTGLDIGLSVASGVDLSGQELRFVSLNSAGAATIMANLDAKTIGVVQRSPRADGGEGVTVRTDGVSRVVAGGALPVGAEVIAEYVSATDQGKALALPVAADTYRVRGIVIKPAIAENEIAVIRLVEYTVVVS